MPELKRCCSAPGPLGPGDLPLLEGLLLASWTFSLLTGLLGPLSPPSWLLFLLPLLSIPSQLQQVISTPGIGLAPQRAPRAALPQWVPGSAQTPGWPLTDPPYHILTHPTGVHSRTTATAFPALVIKGTVSILFIALPGALNGPEHGTCQETWRAQMTEQTTRSSARQLSLC